MVDPSIPSDINDWDGRRTAAYYTDELAWNLRPLKPASKEPMFNGNGTIAREKLLNHIDDGANLGVIPAGAHVILDLDSKFDDGESAKKFLEKQDADAQSLPRERTAGGYHVHVRIKDIEVLKSKFPGARKLVGAKTRSKVGKELFFGGEAHVVVSPSVNGTGKNYQWETFGVIPEWSWKEFEHTFGEFVPEKPSKKKSGDEETRARKWRGDLKTLNIVALVQEAGLWVEEDSHKPGTHVVACPWSGDHSNGETTAAVFDNGEGCPPGFNCFHSHCCKKGVLDFLDHVEAAHPGLVDKHCAAEWEYKRSSKDRRGRPHITLPGPGREKDDFVEDVGDVLKDKEFWFVHASDIVRIDREPRFGVDSEGNRVEICERLKLQEVTPEAAESTLGEHVATGHVRKVEMPDGGEKQTFVIESLSATDADMLMASPRLPRKLPRIDRLLDIPLPHPHGKELILPRRGYNRELGVLVDQDIKLRLMPLEQAIAILGDISSEFCFVDDDGGQSKCHWYARLVTPMVRGIMGWRARMPMWVFIGNRPGCGKDYANGVAQILYYGYAFEDSAIAPRNSEETEKRITAAHAAGRRSLHFANQQGVYLDDQALIASITCSVHRSRRLGSNSASAAVEYPNELEHSMSANVGLQWRGDIPRRCRFIRMAFFEQDVNARRFKRPDLHSYVHERREEILSAIYSLVMYWKQQGCPPGGVFTSFPEWGKVVGGILETCGLGNPCLPTEWGGMNVGGDSRDEAMSAVFEAGYEKGQEQIKNETKDGRGQLLGDWLNPDVVCGLVGGSDPVTEQWNGLEKPKDKELFGRDLKVYNLRTLDGITLTWEDPTRKLSRTKVRFWKVPDTAETPPQSKSPTFSDEKVGSSDGEDGSRKCPADPYCPRSVPPSDVEEKFTRSAAENSSKVNRPPQTGQYGSAGQFQILVDDPVLLQKAITALDCGSALALDVETYGPPPKMVGKKKITDPWGPSALDPLRCSIRLLTLKSENSEVYTIDLDRVIFTPELKDLLSRKVLVGHNLFFDLACLKVRYGVTPDPGKLFDTMLVSRILTNGDLEKTVKGKWAPVKNGLEDALKRYIGIDTVKDQGKSDWSAAELSPDQLRYVAEDVAHLITLKEAQELLLERDDLQLIAGLENGLLPIVVDLFIRGFAVDKAMLENMLVEAEQKKEQAAGELRKALNAPQLNVDSVPQLLNAFAAIGMALPDTDKGTAAYHQSNPAVAALIRYRAVKSGETEKMQSLIDAIRPDGRIHATFNQLGADTGRFSCCKPNLQQTPNMHNSRIRTTFKAPEGRKLVEWDYERMEFIAAACWCGESKVLDLQRNEAGLDPDEVDHHRKTAEAIYSVPAREVDKKQRTLGKRTNFLNIFGGGFEGFREKLKTEGINITLAEAEHIQQAFFKLYPGFKTWHWEAWTNARNTFPRITEVRTPLQRRRLLPGACTAWDLFTAQVNTPIQGGCADAMKWAMIELYPQLPEGAFFVLTLHDGLYVECDEKDAVAIEELGKKIMERIATEVFDGKKYRVTLTVESKLKYSWGE